NRRLSPRAAAARLRARLGPVPDGHDLRPAPAQLPRDDPAERRFRRGHLRAPSHRVPDCAAQGGVPLVDVANFLLSWTTPNLLLLTALGTFAGIYVGVIPGLSVTMAAAILISFTFSWETHSALALIAGVFLGGVYGGARTAILLNIPGGPSSVASALDGYPLAQRGEAGPAIGLATIFTVVGGFVGVLALALAAPVIARFALMFAPRDYLLVAMIGLLLVGSLASGTPAKGIFAAALGVVIGLVGMDPMTAQPRFT